LKLGLTEKQIQTIRKYQSKGGYFRIKADFLKIYGITESEKRALTDYVAIEEKGNVKYEKTTEVIELQVEINASDSIELMKLPGIGNKLSKRIVKYRDLLGGFYSLAQLKEVYGLSEPVIQQINKMVRVDPAHIRKVDLNFADWHELAKHPYIQKDRALQIVKFRTKYGSIQNPEVLRDSMILNIDEYARLKPYL
jgi:DNA uptake protein ComE-like DNA-binding protein